MFTRFFMLFCLVSANVYAAATDDVVVDDNKLVVSTVGWRDLSVSRIPELCDSSVWIEEKIFAHDGRMHDAANTAIDIFGSLARCSDRFTLRQREIPGRVVKLLQNMFHTGHTPIIVDYEPTMPLQEPLRLGTTSAWRALIRYVDGRQIEIAKVDLLRGALNLTAHVINQKDATAAARYMLERLRQATGITTAAIAPNFLPALDDDGSVMPFPSLATPAPRPAAACSDVSFDISTRYGSEVPYSRLPQKPRSKRSRVERIVLAEDQGTQDDYVVPSHQDGTKRSRT